MGSDIFKQDHYEPLVARITEKVEALVASSPAMVKFHHMMAACPEMICTIQEEEEEYTGRICLWSNTPLKKTHYQIVLSKEKNQAETRTFYFAIEYAERLAAIHVIYHLWKYINLSYVHNYKTSEIATLNFMNLWVYLVGADLAELPISKWEEPFFEIFSDNIYQIFKTYAAIDAWSKL